MHARCIYLSSGGNNGEDVCLPQRGSARERSDERHDVALLLRDGGTELLQVRYEGRNVRQIRRNARGAAGIEGAAAFEASAACAVAVLLH